MVVSQLTLSVYVLNLGYGFEDALKPLGNFTFVSELFSEDCPSDRWQTHEIIKSAAIKKNPSARKWSAAIPVPVPRNYLVGIDLQQRDFEQYVKPSYLAGEWRAHGWWYYYIYAVAIKVPLGLSALATVAFAGRLFGQRAAMDSGANSSIRDEFILLLPLLIIFSFVSLKTGFNEHLRYVLLCYPFVFILVSSSLSYLLAIPRALMTRSPGRINDLLWHAFNSFLVTLAIWFVVSSLWIYPHSLSYFNEVVGGPLNGSEYLLGSNVDWGQDLCYLKNRMIAKGETIEPIYFGGFRAADVGFRSSGEPLPKGIWRSESFPKKDEYHMRSIEAVSINTLEANPQQILDESLMGRIATIRRMMLLENCSLAESRVGYSIKLFAANASASR